MTFLSLDIFSALLLTLCLAYRLLFKWLYRNSQMSSENLPHSLKYLLISSEGRNRCCATLSVTAAKPMVFQYFPVSDAISAARAGLVQNPSAGIRRDPRTMISYISFDSTI
ncbi:hypothetical protein C8J56DRAFT_890258 [Mycena floridula]|nr:hypothetical protein C8J56DRAFT_890258 [Mycena floridula]